MTKPRPPLSIDAALARIAGQLERGWESIAEVTGRKNGLVRAWGDPARRERLPVDDAIVLDLAYRAAGGEGAPIFEAYGARLDAAGVEWFGDQIVLGRYASYVIRECSEAEAALVQAAQPGSTARDRTNALREIEEAIAVLSRARMMIGGPPPFGNEPEHLSTGPPS